MSRYALHRFVTTGIVLFAVSLITYGLIYLTPGDPAYTILNQQLQQPPSSEQVEAFRTEQGLDEPVYIQYANWIADVLRGDFGTSYYEGRPVSTMMIEDLPATLELALAAMAVSLVIAVPTGVLSAIHRDTSIDRICQISALVGVSMPNFWLGYLLIILFSLWLGLTPVSGVGGIEYLLLPAITLGTGMAAIVTRLIRTSMLDVLDEEYIDTARSKGLRERIVVYKHALRNALIPIVTIVGLQFGFVLNGAVIVEIVFQRPGLGMLLVDAIFARDYPVVQGVVLLTAVIFVATNLLVDLVYQYLDPRISIGGSTA